MFLMSGAAKYLDVLERTLYNAALSGISMQGDRFFYPNPLESNGQHQRQKWFGVACCPGNITRFSTDPAGVAVSYFPTVLFGDCPLLPLADVTCTPPSGSTFPVGTTTVTATATDGCGQSAQCSFTVTVNPPPTPGIWITLPKATKPMKIRMSVIRKCARLGKARNRHR